MSENAQPGKENRRPPSGPVSSPRAYFGRASRAATGALRAGISEVPEPGPPTAPRRPHVYRAGDPALRLFAGFTLPLPPTTPLTGAIAALSGIADGEHEKLFIDLGTSLVRATPRRDAKAGTLSLILSRTQSAETYSTLLASLRYVNDAPEPTNGVRQLALQIVDAGGRAKDVATAVFGIGEAPPEPELVAEDGRIVFGEKLAFNTDGDYTLFWWPDRLPPTAERARGATPPVSPARADASPEAAAGSFFSAGGKLYRLFDAASERPSPAPPEPQPIRLPPPVGTQAPAANDSAPPRRATANNPVWVPGRGVPPPGFERANALRLEDIFGSDMQDAIARRLIDLRIAAG